MTPKWFAGGSVHYDLSDTNELLGIVIDLPHAAPGHDSTIRIGKSAANFKRLKQLAELVGLLLMELNNKESHGQETT